MNRVLMPIGTLFAALLAVAPTEPARLMDRGIEPAAADPRAAASTAVAARPASVATPAPVMSPDRAECAKPPAWLAFAAAVAPMPQRDSVSRR